MRTIRVYTSTPLTAGQSLALDTPASNHLARVLRARVGDSVTAFNGDGYDYRGTISEITKLTVVVALTEVLAPVAESPLDITLGLAISKGDRFDWAIQKATELGVTRIVPLLTERVDVKLSGERSEKKQRHWQGVVISACEQCGRATVPEVAPVQALRSWLATVDAACKLVLHHHNVAPLTGSAPPSIALLIGPEGGLSEADLEAAFAGGFAPLRLGPRVLRTETAPAVALAVLGYAWGDLAH